MIKTISDIISAQIGSIFDRGRAALIGPRYTKRIVFSMRDLDPSKNIASAYIEAFLNHGMDVRDLDPDILKALVEKTIHVVASAEQKHIDDATRKIQDMITAHQIERDHLKSESSNASLLSGIRATLEEQKQKIQNHLDVISETEIANAQNFGSMDGIVSVAKKVGIEDPVVFKVMVKDERTCKHCGRLWLLEDKITPRVYRLSELSALNADVKESVASVGLTHPNCRCVITVLMPGFGFTAGGRVTYIGNDHDEFKHQRGL